MCIRDRSYRGGTGYGYSTGLAGGSVGTAIFNADVVLSYNGLTLLAHDEVYKVLSGLAEAFLGGDVEGTVYLICTVVDVVYGSCYAIDLQSLNCCLLYTSS